MTSPNDHLRRLREMVCTSELLPPGNIANLSNELLVQWLYMSYHHTDRQRFVESGKRLEDESDLRGTLANGSLKKKESQHESTKNQQADD